jgi:hypothetical protein
VLLGIPRESHGDDYRRSIATRNGIDEEICGGDFWTISPPTTVVAGYRSDSRPLHEIALEFRQTARISCSHGHSELGEFSLFVGPVTAPFPTVGFVA